MPSGGRTRGDGGAGATQSPDLGTSESRERATARPLPRCTRILVGQGVRQCHGTVASPEISIMQAPYPSDVCHQVRPKALRHHRHAVFGALSVPYAELHTLEVDVLDSQCAALHQAKSTAVHQAGHQTTWLVQL